MFGLFGRKSEPADFWEWLRENTERIQSELRARPKKVADQIGRAFDRSYPTLFWEVGPKPSGPWEFRISADGNRERFPDVIRAVEAAPELPGWTIHAFRARGSSDDGLEIGGHKLTYDDVWCGIVERQEDGVRMVLCVRGLTEENDDLLTRAAVIMLDNAVGEYDAVMKVKELGRDRLPDDPCRADNFFPLSELPAYLDQLGGRPPNSARR